MAGLEEALLGSRAGTKLRVQVPPELGYQASPGAAPQVRLGVVWAAPECSAVCFVLLHLHLLAPCPIHRAHSCPQYRSCFCPVHHC